MSIKSVHLRFEEILTGDITVNFKYNDQVQES